MRIISNTLLGDVSITTVKDGLGEQWTLIATAEGEDVLVLPNGVHIELLHLPVDHMMVRKAYSISEMVLSGERVR